MQPHNIAGQSLNLCQQVPQPRIVAHPARLLDEALPRRDEGSQLVAARWRKTWSADGCPVRVRGGAPASHRPGRIASGEIDVGICNHVLDAIAVARPDAIERECCLVGTACSGQRQHQAIGGGRD